MDRSIIHSADLASHHAALFRIAVIGEAVSHLPVEVQALAPGIAWNDIKAMRNHIVHGYWPID